MIHNGNAQGYELYVDWFPMKFSKAPADIKVNTHVFHALPESSLREQLGDYGHFTDCEDFCCEGNIFTALESLPLEECITPMQHRVSQLDYSWGESDCVLARLNESAFIELYKPLCLSLPINDNVKVLLTSLSTRLTNGHFVTRVIQCPPDPRWPDSSRSTTSFCTFVKPLIWSRNAGVDSVSEEQSGDETMGDRARVNDVDGMEL